MGKRWKHHLAALLLFVAVGLAVSLTVAGWIGSATPGSADWSRWIRLVGTRFTGYGTLVLLGTALSIGPLARLQPRRFAWLLAYRRAVGIWSAIGGSAHLLFVLAMVQQDFGKKPWTRLFLHQFRGYDADGTLIVRYGVSPEPISMVAWTGLIALGLLLLVALVSNDRAQRLLGQPAWKLVQQWTYTAFLFVALHVGIMSLAGGKLKGSPPLMRWSLWLLVAVALLQMSGFLYTVWRHRARQS